MTTAPRAGAAGLVALVLAALALRPQIVGAGPLFPDIEQDLGASHAVVGLLGTIPVLCMGLFAPPAAYLAARLGSGRAMTVSLASVGIFGLLRAVAPEMWQIVALTFPVGMGMGLSGALVPVAVKERFADRPAQATGLYTMGIQIGSTVAAAVAVPIAGWLGGWRFALGAFSVAALASTVAWAALDRRAPVAPRARARPPLLPWRSPVALLLTAMFALMGSAYYGLNAWIPDAYTELGWSERSAGVLLAAMTVSAVPASFVVPWLFARRSGRQVPLVALSLLYGTCAAGLVALPELAWGFALCSGLAQGGLFALVLTLPLEIGEGPDEVGALVGIMLGGGYCLSAASPFLLGAVRDWTGSFDGPLWVTVAFLAVLVAAAASLPRVREREAAG